MSSCWYDHRLLAIIWLSWNLFAINSTLLATRSFLFPLIYLSVQHCVMFAVCVLSCSGPIHRQQWGLWSLRQHQSGHLHFAGSSNLWCSRWQCRQGMMSSCHVRCIHVQHMLSAGPRNLIHSLYHYYSLSLSPYGQLSLGLGCFQSILDLQWSMVAGSVELRVVGCKSPELHHQTDLYLTTVYNVHMPASCFWSHGVKFYLET